MLQRCWLATLAFNSFTLRFTSLDYGVAFKYYLLDIFCSKRPPEHGRQISSTHHGTFCIYKVRSVIGHESPEGEQRHSSILSITSALDGTGWSSRPGHFTPGRKTRYPSYRRLSWHQGWCGRVRRISPLHRGSNP
jgi:hypothetical protein